MNKAHAQRVHARRRAAERYGLTVGRSTHAAIVAAIRAGRSTLVRRQSNRVSVHDVRLSDGYKVRVVYDKRTGQLVTFLSRQEAMSG